MTAAEPTSSHAERGLEWLSAIAMVGWCYVIVRHPGYLLASNLHEFLRFGLTEGQVAAGFGVVGALRIAALYINGRWPRSPLLRMAGAAVGLVLWSQVTLTLVMAVGTASTGVVIYGPLAFAEFISIRRAAFDARYHRQ
jgi:hypothetical protein